MRKMKLLIVLLLAYSGMKAQNSCATAIPIIADSVYSITTQSENWFSFIATDSIHSFQFFPGVLGGSIDPILFEIRQGCHQQVLVTDTFANSFLDYKVYVGDLIMNSTYHFKFVNGFPNSTFKVRLRNQPEGLGEACINPPPVCEHVCNGGFEDISLTYSIPRLSPEEIEIMNAWGRPPKDSPLGMDGSPDGYWFNGTVGNQLLNLWTVANAPYGRNNSNGLIGLVTNSSDNALQAPLSISTFREYAQTKLNSPLVFGRFYYAEMHVKHFEDSRFYSDRIGMYFSANQIVQPSSLLQPVNIPVIPQIETNSTIGNSWTAVGGIVTNPSNQNLIQYLTIGNFRSNSYSQDSGPISTSGWGQVPYPYVFYANNMSAYYLIDDVSVIELPWAGLSKQVCSGEIVSIGEACNMPPGLTIEWIGPNTNVVSTVMPFTFTAFTSGVYTLKVTYKGHTYTDNVSVTVDCCTKPNVDYTFLDDQNASFGFASEPIVGGVRNVSNKTIVMNKNFALNEDITFTNCHFYMGPGAEIRIVGNVNATFIASTLESCDKINMWKGIRSLFATSTLSMLGTTVLEAEIGVEIAQGGTTTILECVFENNYIGVEIKPFASTLPLVVEQTIFNTSTSLLHPHNGLIRAHAGIWAQDVDFLTISDEGNQEADWRNRFINFDYGIKIERTNAAILANEFYQCLYGIFADGHFQQSTNIFNVQIGHHNSGVTNLFESNNHGVFATRGIDAFIWANDFKVNASGVTFTNQPNGHNFNAHFNNFENDAIGIDVTELVRPNLDLNGNNFMHDIETRRNVAAIRVANAIPPSRTWIPSGFGTSGTVTISSNIITGYNDGIKVTNVAKPTIQANMIYDLPANWNFTTHGINLYNCPEAEINSNIISGNNAGIWASHGILSDFAADNVIRYNCVKDVGRGIWVGGHSAGVKMESNLMKNCLTGFFANWAFIGQQARLETNGSQMFWLPSDNMWEGQFTNHLYNHQPISNTNGFTLRAPGSAAYDVRFNPNPMNNNGLSMILNSSFVTPQLETTYPKNEPYCLHPAIVFKANENPGLTPEEIAFIADTSSITVFTPDDVAIQWLQNQSLYRELVQDTINYNNNALLASFLGVHSMGTIGEIENIDELILLGIEEGSLTDLAIAISANNALNATELPEQTTQQLNSIYLNQLSDLNWQYKIDSADMLTLAGIADLCPYYYGTAVYQARALLAMVDTTYTPHTHACEMGYQYGMAKAEGLPADASNSYFVNKNRGELLAYPNPTSGYVLVEYMGTEKQEALIVVIANSQGVDLLRTDMASGFATQIDMNSLPDGIYIARVLKGNQVLAYEKIVLVKQ